MTTPPRRKKLIEVALPLEAINAASAREKSIRHGHPSTLHLWWARRPLAACRAVLFGSLVDDPGSDPAYHNPDGTVDEERAGLRRAELFNLIEELVKWENSNNPKVINAARAEIAASVASRQVELGELQKDTIVFGDKAGEPHPEGPLADDGATAWRVMLRRSRPEVVNHFLATYAPPVLDPFAGGGSIPLEAQRLGLRAHASDLNPVPVLINKALIEIPPRFANQPPVHPDVDRRTGWSGAAGLAEDVRRYGKWMRDRAEERIGHLYPKVKISAEMARERPDLKPYIGEELTVIAWLWARTVASPDPALGGKHIPLVRSFWLSKRKGREAYVRPHVDKARGEYNFVVEAGTPNDGFDPDAATVVRAGGTCLISGAPVPFAHIRAEGKHGRLRQQLLAVVCEGNRERVYLDPTEVQEQAALSVQPENYPVTDLPEQALSFRVQLYGMDQHWKLFTARQLEALVTFSGLVSEVREKILAASGRAGRSDPSAYADAVTTMLGLSFGKLTVFHSTLGRWRPNEGKSAPAFGRQALPMVWDYPEVNPFAGAGGDWTGVIDGTVKTLLALPTEAWGRAEQGDATSEATYGEQLIATDPPYYDNIGYADLSDFFYVWLRRALRPLYPDLLSTMLTPKSDELIATPYRHSGSKAKASAFFEDGLGNAIGLWRKFGHEEYPTTIFYAFKQTETDKAGTASTGWETFLAGIIRHGFAITATWPMRTEGSSRLVGRGANALASSIVLACVPREPDAPLATRREFADALRAELPEAIRHLQSGNVAPVDLAQASIGPGMAAFSRYSKVVNADGMPMSVREALQLINQVLDEALAEQESDFDAETRFALTWFEQHGLKDGAFGDAETLSKAMAVSVRGVVEAGVVASRGSKVRVLKRSELNEAWDPQTDTRLTIWEVTQHLIRQLEAGGELAAADLLRKVGAGAGQTARELAYRLYQTCERKKWADEARAYNGLVVSWPEIERLARQGRAEPKPADAALFASE